MEYSKVGKYYEVFSGYAFKSQDLKETADIPIIKIGNISNGRNVINENMQFVSKELLGINKKYYVNRGDVLLSLTGSHMNQPNSVVGRSCRNYSDRLYLLNQRAGKIVPKNNASLSYIYYVLQTQAMKEMICCRAYGAANQVNVSPKSIMSIKWNFPSSDVQHSIASILSTYDTLIENNTKRIRLLEKMAENLYKEWFVRFRFPGHENVEMENGLPKGWKYVNFSNLSPILTGKKDANYASQNGKYKFFTCSKNDLVADNYSFDCFAIILAGNGDLNVKLYDGQFEAYQRTYVLSPYDVEHIYVSYYTIQSELDRLLVGAAGAVIKFLTKGMIEKIKVLLPTNDVLVRFNSIQEHNYRLRQNLKRQNSLLARQRDLLLPRLMSGKLEVKEELLE